MILRKIGERSDREDGPVDSRGQRESDPLRGSLPSRILVQISFIGSRDQHDIAGPRRQARSL